MAWSVAKSRYWKAGYIYLLFPASLWKLIKCDVQMQVCILVVRLGAWKI